MNDAIQKKKKKKSGAMREWIRSRHYNENMLMVMMKDHLLPKT